MGAVMNGAAWLLVISTLGVDFGWQIAPDGKLEYIIQIPPSQYEKIRDNPNGVDSNLPPEVVRHVQRIRVVVGESQLPRDELPAANEAQDFAPGSTRARPRGVNFPPNTENFNNGNFNNGFPEPPESSVTLPPDAPERALPGPDADLNRDTRTLPYTPIPPPPVNRATLDAPDFGDFGTGRPQAVIRRNSLDLGNWRPNTSSPGMFDRAPTTNFNDVTSFPDRQATFNTAANQPFGTTNRFGTDNRFGVDNRMNYNDPRSTPTAPLAASAVGFTVLALLFSIGLNLFLGWLAWEYYLKYRDSFESWRSSR
jgi:hypothetical protein